MKLPGLFTLGLIISQCSAKSLVTNKLPKFSENPKSNNPRTVTAVRQRNVLPKLELESKPDIWDINKGILSEMKEGDVQQRPQARNTMREDVYGEYIWNTTTIPMTFASSATLLTKAAVDEARREYELRTCFSFPERTDEDDYILIEVLGGCYSSLGRQGGGQTVSIGRRCEEMYTVAHEFMHAIGIWHEQSRADRDDYVEIKYEPIIDGLEYNFNTHDLDETDDRRVPYDFDSVMHYGKTAFTEDGNNTIVTRDPAFQDAIGQKSGFSEGDVTKISRMYGCSDTLRITNTVNFEEANAGGYSQVGLNGDVSWIKHDLGVSDTSGPTTKYLPKFDSTFGVDGKGSFMYLDTSGRIAGLSGAIKSMRYTTNVAHQCLEYSYFMKLNSGSTATMYVYLAEIDEVTGEIMSYGDAIRTHNSHTGGLDVWWVERMTIAAPSSYRLVFWAKTGYNYNDIIAVDDVTVMDKECDSTFFQVVDYPSMMLNYDVDEYFVSPTMYTGQPGYAFQLMVSVLNIIAKVYPSGTQGGIDEGRPDWMGVYFRLVGGLYDDDLEWPFDSQFIRVVVTDQGPKPLTRLNYYDNFITNGSLAEEYGKPTTLGATNKPVGWTSFMANFRLSTRDFLKHDVIYFSVQVTDMRPYEGSTEISAKMRNPVLRRPQNIVRKPEPRSFNFEEPEPYTQEPDIPHREDSHEGMMTVGQAAMLILIASGSVFVIMSITICVVAMSYRKRVKKAAVVMDVRYGPGLSVENDVKYSDRREIL